MKTQRVRQFKVVAVASNRNSFGLTGMVLLAKDGEGWEVAANALNLRRREAVVNVPLIRNRPNFAALGWELPRRLPDAPAAVVREVWQ